MQRDTRATCPDTVGNASDAVAQYRFDPKSPEAIAHMRTVLFRAAANRHKVDLDAPPRSVPGDAPMPEPSAGDRAEPTDDDDCAKPACVLVPGESPDKLLQDAIKAHKIDGAIAPLAQARTLETAAQSILEILHDPAVHAVYAAEVVDAARARLARPVQLLDTVPTTHSIDATCHGIGQTPTGHSKESRAALWIAKHDLSTRKSGRITYIVAKRCTGKAVLYKDMWNTGWHGWDCVLAMSPTPESQEMFREHMPDACIHGDYNGDAIKALIEKVTEMRAFGFEPRVFIVLDNCMHGPSVWCSQEMRDLHSQAAALGIDVCNITEYAMNLPKALCSHIDYAYTMREPQNPYRKNLYRDFFGVFDNYDEFAAALDTCTANAGWMVVDNAAAPLTPEKNVFWYCASPHPPSSKWGCAFLWKLAYAYGRPAAPTLLGSWMATPALPGLASLL